MELQVAVDEKNPYKEKYDARKGYERLLDEMGDLSEEETTLYRAKIKAYLARNYFDTDQNTDARNFCKDSLADFSTICDPEKLVGEINSIVFCLNNLGFHSVLGERFYEGVYYLTAAERAYRAVKSSLGRNVSDLAFLYAGKSEEAGAGQAIKKDWSRAICKVFLKNAFIPSQMLSQIGEFLKTSILKNLTENLELIQNLSSNPEENVESSELTQKILKMIPVFSRDLAHKIDINQILEINEGHPGMDLFEFEDHHIQTVFFLAQVFAKLLERDLSATNCGKTLQRQYFKLICLKKDRKEGEVLDFDFTDFTNNSMGLSMYYSEKLMYKQGLGLLALAEGILEGESKQVQLLRGSIKHMRGNLFRDFFMHNALILKEEGPEKLQSKCFIVSVDFGYVFCIDFVIFEI